MSKDLLGDETPDPPAMTAPIAWRIFKVSESEWYIARSLAEAKATAAEDWGYASEDPEFLEMVEDAYELDDEAMDRLQYVDSEGHAKPVSFREALASLTAAGIKAPFGFASEDY